MNKSSTQESNDKLIRKKQVAEMLAISLKSVERLVQSGQLTRIKILGAIRFRLSQVLKLMNEGPI